MSRLPHLVHEPGVPLPDEGEPDPDEDLLSVVRGRRPSDTHVLPPEAREGITSEALVVAGGLEVVVVVGLLVVFSKYYI